MSLNRNSLFALVAAAATLTLSACGANHNMLAAPARVVTSSAESAQNVPPTSAFVTVQATVTEILPVDNSGLPHQNFIATINGVPYQVNNDTHYGTAVPNLTVGEKLTMKGVEYHDTTSQNGAPKDGIHWTHHADKPGDAGYIQTPDGHIYQ